MTDNLRHWDALARTDPAHTKPFQRAGGFKGTAIKPIWSSKMMTAHFGPCGAGWGMEKPEFTTMPVGDEILVYCTVALWYREGESEGNIVYGVGGDKVAVKRKDGRVDADDEAFKKAYTDALSNAMKQIGVGADVHMGLFDDAKYVNEMRKEFAEDDPPPPLSDLPQHRIVANAIKAAIDASPHLDALNILMEHKGVDPKSAAPRVGSDLELVRSHSEDAYTFLLNRAQMKRGQFLNAPATQRKAS